MLMVRKNPVTVVKVIKVDIVKADREVFSLSIQDFHLPNFSFNGAVFQLFFHFYGHCSCSTVGSVKQYERKDNLNILQL
jgi:hypothetical protein